MLDTVDSVSTSVRFPVVRGCGPHALAVDTAVAPSTDRQLSAYCTLHAAGRQCGFAQQRLATGLTAGAVSAIALLMFREEIGAAWLFVCGGSRQCM